MKLTVGREEMMTKDVIRKRAELTSFSFSVLPPLSLSPLSLSSIQCRQRARCPRSDVSKIKREKRLIPLRSLSHLFFLSPFALPSHITQTLRQNYRNLNVRLLTHPLLSECYCASFSLSLSGLDRSLSLLVSPPLPLP